jgi:hypothetical protein
MFHIWAFSHSHVTANPSTEIKENKGLPCTPSFLSALLKYSLQKINCAIAAQHNSEFMSLLAAQAPKARIGAPTAAGLQQVVP